MTLSEKFTEFHNANPSVWKHFEKFALRAVVMAEKRGWNYVSADMIAHRVRWETNIETSDLDFKINNNHVAYYSRLFQSHYPQFKDFFRNRSVKEKGIVMQEALSI